MSEWIDFSIGMAIIFLSASISFRIIKEVIE